MAEVGLRRDTAGGILTLSFDRPRSRNALDLATFEALVAALGSADGDGNLRAVVLRGADEGPFSAGFDLTGLPEVAVHDDRTARRLHEPIRRAADAVAGCRHPVVAAIRGHALGAGLDLAAHADLRVAAADATFALPASRLGFAYPLAGIQRFTRTLGPTATEALLLEAREFTATEMEANGFLHRVWPPERFEDSLRDYLDKLSRRAPLAMRAMKRTLRLLASDGGQAKAEVRDYQTIAACLNSADAREGPAAFRERRPPRFEGQ